MSMSTQTRNRFAAVAAYVTALPPGEQAELRRRGASAPPPCFWQIVERYDIAPAEEAAWAEIVRLMVSVPHNGGARPGIVLNKAGVSSARVERWLRMDRNAALREASRLLTQVKGQELDWQRMGGLLLYWGDADRRSFARDYFVNAAREAENPVGSESNEQEG